MVTTPPTPTARTGRRRAALAAVVGVLLAGITACATSTPGMPLEEPGRVGPALAAGMDAQYWSWAVERDLDPCALHTLDGAASATGMPPLWIMPADGTPTTCDLTLAPTGASTPVWRLSTTIGASLPPAAGRVTHDVLRHWWRLVDQRWLHLTQHLHNLVRTHTHAAGRLDIHIEHSAETTPALAALRETVTRDWPTTSTDGGTADPHTALTRTLTASMLAGHSGAEWNTLLRHLPQIPATVRDLALAGYTWPLTRAALTPTTDQPTVTIMIDDPSEHRLYRTTRHTLASFAAEQGTDPHPFVGIFPLRRLHLAGAPGTRSLYWDTRTPPRVRSLGGHNISVNNARANAHREA